MKSNDSSGGEDYISRPTYDGRQEYYKIVRLLIETMANFNINDAFDAWLDILNTLYCIVKPYISATDAKKIYDLLIDAENYLMNIQRHETEYIYKRLVANFKRKMHNINIEIFTAGKHLLLPLKTDEIEEFNEEKLIKMMFGDD